MNLISRASCVFLICLIFSNLSFADDSCTPAESIGTDVNIALNDDALPASDLTCDTKCLASVHSDSSTPYILNPEDAWNYHKQFGLDLSNLEPDASTDIWKGDSPTEAEDLDASLAVINKDQVQYVADICSSSGRYRFNIQNKNGQTLTLMLSKTLHTFLLRKELLRKLGYVIPPMKYLPHVIVHFPSEKIRDSVLNKWLPLATDGITSRWCSISASVLAKEKTVPCNSAPDSELGGDPLTVDLQDVMVMEATPLYYNTAIGPPIVQLPNSTNLRAEQYRTLRALSVIYDLANIPQSLNQLDWYAARAQNENVYFHIDDQANFGTTIDDARWIMKKIAKLSREDFKEIVKNSSYPDGIGKVLVEKLISRRNSLLSSLGMKEFNPLPVDNNINVGTAIVSGKVVQQDWPGYASRFAQGDPQNPLEGIWWYVLSEVQSNAMEALVSYANSKIPSINTQSAYAAHEAKIQQALLNALETGQSTSVPFGAWAAPVVNGSVQISRNIVLGQYLGTNNLVQLADTFGFTANAGIMIGFDGLAASMSAQGQVQGSASISLTHLKPLLSLKDGVTEPLEKEIVPWVFGKAAGVLQGISDAQSEIAKGKASDLTGTQKVNNSLVDDLAKLKDYLGVGESFIVTASLSGLQQLQLGYLFTAANGAAPAIDVSGSMNELMLSRVQFYRRDQNTIVVFKDYGQLLGPTLSFEFTLGQVAQFPVINLSASGVTGSGSSNVYNVDITPDINKNPRLFAATAALAKSLRSGSASPIQDGLQMRPIVLETKFTDTSSSFQFFHYYSRGLKTSSDIRVSLPDGFAQSFVKLSDGHQTGSNYQALATQVANFLLQYSTKNGTYTIDTQSNQNPGQSFYGSSQTRNASFEGVLNGGTKPSDPPSLDQPYVLIAYRWEGWDITAKDILKLAKKLSAKYGFQLYPDNFLGDTKDIKMYQLFLGVNVYQSGINNILAMSEVDEEKLLNKYRALHGCETSDSSDSESERARRTSDDYKACSAISSFSSAFSDYRRGVSANSNHLTAPTGFDGFINSALNIFHLGTPTPIDGEKMASLIFKMVNNLEQFASFSDLVNLVGGQDHLYVAANLTGFKNGTELSSDQGLVSNTFGKADGNNPSGPISTAQSLLNVSAGEFNLSWIRNVL